MRPARRKEGRKVRSKEVGREGGKKSFRWGRSSRVDGAVVLHSAWRWDHTSVSRVTLVKLRHHSRSSDLDIRDLKEARIKQRCTAQGVPPHDGTHKRWPWLAPTTSPHCHHTLTHTEKSNSSCASSTFQLIVSSDNNFHSGFYVTINRNQPWLT